MEQYIALLRGINQSGKNKIAMSELKALCKRLGFLGIFTYLNSGNLVFSAGSTETAEIKRTLEKGIQCTFGLQIPVHVLRMEELKDILSHAPDWWNSGDKARYDNLIFILSGDTAETLCALIGAPSEGLEQIEVYRNIIFWTFDRTAYQKCSWWKKTARAGIAEKLTIRTANTLGYADKMDTITRLPFSALIFEHPLHPLRGRKCTPLISYEMSCAEEKIPTIFKSRLQ